MDQQATIENLHWWSQVYFWLAIGAPILGAIAGGLLHWKRQHIEGELRELSAQFCPHELREVEAHQRPRALTADQQRRLIRQLREGPTGRFEIFVVGDPREAGHFARQFDRVLKDAGWTREQSGFGHRVYFDDDFELEILLGLTIDVSRAELAPHGEFLQQALHTVGIDVDLRVNLPVPEMVVRLVVGHKPLPQNHEISQQEQRP